MHVVPLRRRVPAWAVRRRELRFYLCDSFWLEVDRELEMRGRSYLGVQILLELLLMPILFQEAQVHLRELGRG